MPVYMVLARNQGGSPGVDGEARRAGDGYKRDVRQQADFPSSHRLWGVDLSQPPGQVILFTLDMSSILSTHLLFLSLHGDRAGGDLNQLSHLPSLSLPPPFATYGGDRSASVPGRVDTQLRVN